VKGARHGTVHEAPPMALSPELSGVSQGLSVVVSTSAAVRRVLYCVPLPCKFGSEARVEAMHHGSCVVGTRPLS